jgi:hypothetical protein
MIENQDCEFFCGVCFTGDTPTVFLREHGVVSFNVYQCTQCQSYRYEEIGTDFTVPGDTIQMGGPVTRPKTVMTQAAWDKMLWDKLTELMPDNPQ